MIISHILPGWIIKLRRNYVSRKDKERFAGLSTREVFTQVYQEGAFGDSRRLSDPFSSGTGSHQPSIVEPYINAVGDFLTSLGKKPRVVDLGCGDFSVGSRLRHLCDSYIACDIVESLINQNKQNYKDRAVDFRVLDIIEDELPDGDLVFLRQVLQHLSNGQILKIVPKISAAYQYVILTEHLPSLKVFAHNMDKSVGPDIRLFLGNGGSGVVLTSPPFNMKVMEDVCLCESREFGGIIRTNLYRLR